MGALIPGLGGGGGAQAPNLYQPFTAGQIDQAQGNVQNSVASQQALLDALKQQNGTQNQSQVYDQLQGVANGTGPNPAQAMLNNSTGQNVANQAALAAGQRGGSANAGLIARQAAQIGSNAQQQAVGQGAALQANQSLNALGQAGNMANQQVGNQLSANQLQANTALQGQQNLLGAVQGHNNAQNQQFAAQTQNQQSQAGNAMQGIGGLMNALGPVSDMLGGMGGQLSAGATALGAGLGGSVLPAVGGAAEFGAAAAPYVMLAAEGGQIPASPKSHLGRYAHGGKVQALVSPGERYLPPSEVQAVANGKNPMQAGEKIPGQAAVGGAKNSYANDTVPKKLDVGGVVLPRSVTQSKDADSKSREFVAAVLKQKAMKRGK